MSPNTCYLCPRSIQPSQRVLSTGGMMGTIGFSRFLSFGRDRRWRSGLGRGRGFSSPVLMGLPLECGREPAEPPILGIAGASLHRPSSHLVSPVRAAAQRASRARPRMQNTWQGPVGSSDSQAPDDASGVNPVRPGREQPQPPGRAIRFRLAIFSAHPVLRKACFGRMVCAAHSW